MNYFFGTTFLSILSFLNVCMADCNFQGVSREPAYAGSFYPAQQAELTQQLDAYLSTSHKTLAPKIIIVPHAGYSYSATTASKAYSLLTDSGYKRIILIGVSHKHSFEGIAVDDSAAYRTPLGDVPVDLSFVTALTSSDGRIQKNAYVHKDEHSLEVQIPFLQKTLKDFSIVPILLSQDDGTTSEFLADSLTKLIDDETLVVISTDLSHYPPEDVAEQVDTRMVQAILGMNINTFDAEVNKYVDQLPGLSTRACGAKAVRVGMLLAKKLQLDEPKLLSYSNSAGVENGDPDRVVGYAAIAFMQSDDSFAFALDENGKHEALMIARDTLISYLKDGTIPDIFVSNDVLKESLGAFVTLNKNGHELRGCMGQFTATEPLGQVIQDKVILAATGDSRFTAVTEDELDDISIEISVLSPMKRVASADEIEMGKHGVYIKKGDRSGTYLPQVAEQFGYDKVAFLDSLAERKAGIAKDSWRDGSAKLYVYEAYVFKEEE